MTFVRLMTVAKPKKNMQILPFMEELFNLKRENFYFQIDVLNTFDILSFSQHKILRDIFTAQK